MSKTVQAVAGMAGGAAIAAVVLAGCSSGGGGSSSQAGSSAMAGSEAVAGAASQAARRPDIAARTRVQTRAVVRTGEIALASEHLGRVRHEIDRLLDALGGSVQSEDSSNGRHGGLVRSTLVLRVPADRFEAAEEALQRLGRVRSSTDSAEDVTTKVIDVDQRVRTLRNSLADLHRFQRSATNVRDLLRYENDITARQSELQSLTAQQRYLSDQTSMGTITVRLSTPSHYAPPPSPLDHAGFLAGLRGGWHALAGAGVLLVTVLGAALPFAVVLAALGVPGWLIVRALLRRRRTANAGS
jgi:uncharacterized protein DUF4349